MAVLMRYSSAAALTAALLAPAYAVFFNSGRPIAALAAFMAVLIFIRHHENIRRLIRGDEPKIGAKKPQAA
jgi:glycerol-3-phosphate acyltransferase PlsY